MTDTATLETEPVRFEQDPTTRRLTIYTPDGTKEYQLPDLPRPDKAEVPEDTAIGTTVESEVEAGEIGTLEQLLEEYSNDDGDDIELRVIDGKRWYFRRLDVLSIYDVETRRLRVTGGNIVRDPAREAKLGLSLEFTACLMRKGANGYEPLFPSIEAAQKFLAKPKALPLIHKLAVAIWEVNPDISPEKKMRIQEALG